MLMFRKTLIIVIVGLIVVPQITFAAWWNPFTWKIFSWLSRLNTTSTVQIERGLKSIASTTQSLATSTEKTELEALKKEMEKTKTEAEKTKADAQAIRIEAERQRLQTEKTKVEAEIAKTETERQRLQSEVDAYKAKEAANTQKQAEINKGTYCNGTYWASCPVGQTFMCPPSGTAFCSSPQSSIDLNSAANNKSELINLQNMEINKERKLLEDDTNEVARANNILNQLTGIPNNGGLAYSLSIAHRNLFMAHQSVDASMIEYTENSKRQIENLDVAAFAVETSVAQLRNTINTNISKTSQEIYERQKEITQYDDSMRAFISILNLAF